MPRTRASIAGLMGVVLVVSLGLAAMRSGSWLWANWVLLLACGVLSLGIVGVACGGANGRAWWVGFSVFGWGYLALSIWVRPGGLSGPLSPTFASLQALLEALGVRWPAVFEGFGEDWSWPPPFAIVTHSIGSVLFAAFGGMLSHFLFAGPIAQPDRPVDDGPTEDRGRRRTALVVGLAGLLLFTAAAVAGARTAPGVWAGATFLGTCGSLALAALRAGFSRGSRRARWLGFTLFGAGYLLLIAGHSEELTWPQYTSNRLLNALRPWLPAIPTQHRAGSDSIASADARILQALERMIPIHFPDETPLEDVLTYVKGEMRGRDGRDVPIYVDPVGLQEAEKTMQSPIKIVLDDIPLRTTLHLILQQLGMTYEVRGGLIHITSASSTDFDPVPAYEDAYLLIGQCVLALLAACLGGVAAPFACGLKS